MTSELGRVMAAARARELAGERVLHLERGEPDFDTPPHIVEALARAARDGFTHYPDQRGEITLREVLAQKLARENGITAHVEDIVVTAGGTHGLYLAMQCLLSPGDELLALSPHWMAIPKLVGFAAGARMRSLPVYLELLAGAWSPGEFAARLREAIGPDTRGIYLNTPNNPTGAVLSREHLAALAEVAIDRDLFVISDEAYEHLTYDGAKHISIGSLPGMAERTLSVFTFSKSYAMTGWRVGYVVSPPALRALFGPLLAFYTTHGVFPSSQIAAREATTSAGACSWTGSAPGAWCTRRCRRVRSTRSRTWRRRGVAATSGSWWTSGSASGSPRSPAPRSDRSSATGCGSRSRPAPRMSRKPPSASRSTPAPRQRLKPPDGRPWRLVPRMR
jgi:aspartate/methionine/tyrosine aminotransferase